MPSKMDGKYDTPSVLAMLMGLDEPSSEQPVKKQKRQRVFSDSYRRRVDSIGVWEKRLSNEFSSFSFRIGESGKLDNVYEMLELSEGRDFYNLSTERGKVDFKLSEVKMQFLRKNSGDANFLPVKRALQSPRELHNVFDISSSDCWRETSKGSPTSSLITKSVIGNLKTKTSHKTVHDNLRLIVAPRFAINRSKQKSAKQNTSTKCIQKKAQNRFKEIKPSDSYSSVSESFNQQVDELIEVYEDSYASSRDSLENLDAACQPSPVSVLETFNDEIFIGPEFFKSTDAGLHGVKLQLQILKSNSLDADSGGPGMVISSDDDSEDESLNSSKENEAMSRLFKRVEESRDFPYMVDLLTEAGFRGKSHMGFEAWHSLDHPISPTVFDTLEKKYGEQDSWKRSERKLFFDRVNLGLAEIHRTSIGIPMATKPVTRRLSSRENYGDYEEELWMLLVNQEKEASKESGKVLGSDDGWLVLGNDVEAISREIEDSLMDELAAEVFS